MRISLDTADSFLATVLARVNGEKTILFSTLDQLDAPIYVTDADGFVTYFNTACVGFTGRVPAVGKDRWCVTWKLYTSAGDFLPHEQCPMAQAIKEGRPVRGVTAIAARPDGSRVHFAPFPTPFFDADGTLKGAINILLDVSDTRQITELHDQAERCRRLSMTCADSATAMILEQMALEYEAKALALMNASNIRTLS